VVFLHLQYGRGFELSDPDIARTVLCIFWMLAEPIRLVAGWYGNLQENVSRLVWQAAGWCVIYRRRPMRGEDVHDQQPTATHYYKTHYYN
jgi:hypothetical protein